MHQWSTKEYRRDENTAQKCNRSSLGSISLIRFSKFPPRLGTRQNDAKVIFFMNVERVRTEMIVSITYCFPKIASAQPWSHAEIGNINRITFFLRFNAATYKIHITSFRVCSLLFVFCFNKNRVLDALYHGCVMCTNLFNNFYSHTFNYTSHQFHATALLRR